MSWEVRTMRSATSSCKGTGLHPWFHPTLFKKNLTRFWPIWSLYGVFWLLQLPVTLLTSYADSAKNYNLGGVDISTSAFFARALVPLSAASLADWMGVVVGVAAAMAVFSYLYQSRSVDLIHALPVRREGLFLTNYLSGLSFFALPLLAVFFLTLLAEAAFGVIYFPGLFTWLCVNLLTALFFYSFAVFCAMFTGHILALPVFYGVLNWLTYGLAYLISLLLEDYVYGFVGATWIDTLVNWLTPFLNLYRSLSVTPVETPDGLGAMRMVGLFPVFVYALAGLVLAGLALLVYRRRQSERAGDIVSVPWVRPVFQYGVAFCTALVLGMFLYNMFQVSLTQSPWLLLFFLLLSGAVGYFAASMLLHKTFRVFRRGWLGLGIFSLVLCLGIAALVFDLTGFERRVPDPARVSHVTVSNVGSYPSDTASYSSFVVTDPEDIALVTRIHAALVTQEVQDAANTLTYSSFLDESGLELEQQASTYFSLTYTLSDGSVCRRQYQVSLSAGELEDPDSITAMLQTLINRPAIVEQCYFGDLLSQEGLRLTEVRISAVVGNYSGYYADELYLEDLTADQRQALLDAILADIDEGNLGRRYLLSGAERYDNCYFNDLELSFSLPDRSSNLTWSSEPATQSISVSTGVTITLQASATHTLSLLEEFGVNLDALITSRDWYSDAIDPAAIQPLLP